MAEKTTLFTDIGAILTLAGVARKDGRRVEQKDLSIRKNVAMVSLNGRIVWIGSRGKVPAEYTASCKTVSLEGRTVLPGFVECHTHLVFAGVRSDEFELRNTGVSYAEIARRGGGILSTVKATRKASEDELYAAAQTRLQRFIDQGVTTIEVKSGYGLKLKEEMKMLRAARRLKKARVITSFLGAHAKPSEQRSTQSYIDRLVKKDLKVLAESGLADRVDIFIEKGFFTVKQGREYLQKSKDLGLKLTIHADQISRTGAGVLGVELAAQSIDHLVQVSKKDIEKIANSSTTAVLLPAADYYLKMAYPPARQLIDVGARVALATDFNPGSSPTQDLATVGLMARIEMKMALPEVIASYTYNAA
ncbi:imidazolonepropionase, partial [Candidatus Kaiserbacteria bacterium]